MTGNNTEIFQRVRNAVDIVDVVAEHIALKRAGKEYKCVCPFHDDHRPSMAVVPQKQIFHCFVCGTGGDVFAFVQNYHKMTAGEALRFLAQKAGIVLPDFKPAGGPGQKEEQSAREIITETNDRACNFYQKYLQGPTGKLGLDYLFARGLTEATMTQFRLGYSPDNWTGLVTAAGRVGIRADDLELAGLVKKRGDGSMYDAFRARVMFPIFDATGRIIAFGGRILAEKRDEAGNVIEAKYLNSPETRVFVKSEALYGLNFAKRSIIESQTVIVVEGYMDVIACHQAGVLNVVATLGTALTAEHAKMLRRFCNTVVLVFDSDDAGYRAADRAMETFVREPLDVKIASVPDGKDPCDFCMAKGGDAFRQVVASATDAISYKWKMLQRDFKTTESTSGKQAAIKLYLKFVADSMSSGSVDQFRLALIVTRVSDLVKIPVEIVSSELKKLQKKAKTQSLAPAFIKSGTEDNASKDVIGSVEPAKLPQYYEMGQSWTIGALLTKPELYLIVNDHIEVHKAFSLKYRKLAALVFEFLEDNLDNLSSVQFSNFLGMIDDGELKTLAINVQKQGEEGGDAQVTLLDGLKAIKEWEWHQKHRDVAEEIGCAITRLTIYIERWRDRQAKEGHANRRLIYRGLAARFGPSREPEQQEEAQQQKQEEQKRDGTHG